MLILQLDTVHLCRSVIRSIETVRIFEFEEFPKRDKVAYMYYTGRLEVFNEDFLAADNKLSYALAHCNSRSEANVRLAQMQLHCAKLFKTGSATLTKLGRFCLGYLYSVYVFMYVVRRSLVVVFGLVKIKCWKQCIVWQS